MLKINNYEFDVKFSEINFRQRNYNGTSYLTVNITNEFYPELVNGNIVYGSIDIKIDLDQIRSINDLVGKTYDNDIGTIHMSVNNDGVWETNTLENFKVEFKNRDNKTLSFKITGKDFIYEDTSRMVSLFTTSTTKEELEKNFDLSDFYNETVKREMSKSVITKYYIK